MSCTKINLVVKSILLSMVPLSFFYLIIWFSGCNKIAEEKKEAAISLTIGNLNKAYGKSVNRQKLYTLFSAQAQKEKRKEIARLFLALARSEQIHAGSHAAMLRSLSVEPLSVSEELIPVGSTMQTLKMALSMEDIAYGTMYQSMISCAEKENHPECAKHLRFIQDTEAKHAELLRYALYKNMQLPVLPYKICKCCGYVLTTEQTDNCPCCKGKKDLFEAI